MNIKTSAGGPALSLGHPPTALSAGDTIQWDHLCLAPAPALKNKGPRQPNLRGKPACRISFFLDSTFIACGRKDPMSWLKWRVGWRESTLHSQVCLSSQHPGSLKTMQQVPHQWTGSNSYGLRGGWTSRVSLALRVLLRPQVSFPSWETTSLGTH